MTRFVRWLIGAGDAASVPPLLARLALAAVFVPVGLGKFLNHEAYITRFERWGFPQPGAMAYLVGTVEVVFGLLMLAGILPRVAGLTLSGNMAGALLTAGVVDGGMNLWLPPVLLALSLFVALRGAGRLALQQRLVPGAPRRPQAVGSSGAARAGGGRSGQGARWT